MVLQRCSFYVKHLFLRNMLHQSNSIGLCYKNRSISYTIWSRSLTRIERGYVVISSLSVGFRNIVLLLSFERQFEKCLCEYFILFLQFQLQRQNNQVLAMSQGSVMVLPLSRESTVGTLDATVFREITDLIIFHVFLILFQLLSKYFS